MFNGLHAVIGYRTDAQAYDHIAAAAAKNIALGAGVVWSWINAVIDAPAYNLDHYYGINPVTGAKIWWGRPSSISVCGNTDDTVYTLDFLEGRPGCL